MSLQKYIRITKQVFTPLNKIGILNLQGCKMHTALNIKYSFYDELIESSYKLYDNNNFIGIIGCIDRNKYCQIINLFIEEEYRRKKYATYLLNHITNIQQSKGYNIMYVNSSNDAKNFYKNNGFIHRDKMCIVDKYIYKLDRAMYYKKI